jgi:hypothetical protein
MRDFGGVVVKGAFCEHIARLLDARALDNETA